MITSLSYCIYMAAIDSPKCITVGSYAYEKLCETLNKPSLLKAIKKASPAQQTSSLEGYHSVVNQFAPKMYAYSYLGLYTRY